MFSIISNIKFVFSKKATKIDEIFTINLTVTTLCQIDSEDFVNFCGLLRKYELLTKKNASTNFFSNFTHFKRQVYINILISDTYIYLSNWKEKWSKINEPLSGLKHAYVIRIAIRSWWIFFLYFNRC